MNALAQIDPPPELEQHVSACVLWSQQNAIATPEQLQLTADHLKEIKTAQKQADEFFDPLVKQAYQLHKDIVARKKVLTAPLEESERIDKAKMLAYRQAEEAKAEAERRRLQAIADEQARKEREKAEQAAARQRAIEAEARAKAEAARRAEEEAKRQAEAASAAKRKKLLEEAEAARKEVESAERKAAAAEAKVMVQEEKAAAVVAPVVTVASAAPKVSGVSVRKTWKAEILDLNAFLEFACESKRFDLLLPNLDTINALAKALKDRASIPGVKFSEEASVSARGR